jgi:hypothetical protein
MELLSGHELLPHADDVLFLIHELVRLGCVDGFTGDQIAKVDGHPLQATTDVLTRLRSSVSSQNGSIAFAKPRASRRSK